VRLWRQLCRSKTETITVEGRDGFGMCRTQSQRIAIKVAHEEPPWFARPGDPLRIRGGVLSSGGTRGGQRALPDSDQSPSCRRGESGDKSGENVELAGAICKPEARHSISIRPPG
jgi:hypothetical protein